MSLLLLGRCAYLLPISVATVLNTIYFGFLFWCILLCIPRLTPLFYNPFKTLTPHSLTHSLFPIDWLKTLLVILGWMTYSFSLPTLIVRLDWWNFFSSQYLDYWHVSLNVACLSKKPFIPEDAWWQVIQLWWPEPGKKCLGLLFTGVPGIWPSQIFMREIEVAATPRLFQLAGYRGVTFSNEGCFSLGRSSREPGRKGKSLLSAQLLLRL